MMQESKERLLERNEQMTGRKHLQIEVKDMTIQEAEEYLAIMEEKRNQNEKYNQRAYADARELSALVSLAEFGNYVIANHAKRVIKNI